jgi:hypothetical protein
MNIKIEKIYDMKKILILLALFAGLIGCKNQVAEFPDYKFTSGYFPYQYPVRTMVLGDYIYDNTNDNNHKFVISAAIGGVYTNDKDRVFTIKVDPTLCNRALYTSSNDTIRLMPSTYYTLSSPTQLTIPKGQYNGGIEVQLADAFFNDPLSIKNTYVVPIRLLSSTDVDTILFGKTSKTNADPRVAGQWDIVPKDFAMFCVKYVNPYHGKWLHRGVAVVKDAGNNVLQTTAYRSAFITGNELWNLVTANMTTVNTSGSVRSTLITGTMNLKLTFTDATTCTVTQNTGSTFTITGSGKLVAQGDEWDGQKRNTIYLNYQFTSGANTYSALDTLVMRDRAVVMELFVPKIY